MDLKSILMFVLGAGAVVFLVLTRKNNNNKTQIPVRTDSEKELLRKEEKGLEELTDKEKNFLDNYFKEYEKKAYNVISEELDIEFFLPVEVSKNLEKKYPKSTFNFNRIIHEIDFTKQKVREYIEKYGKRYAKEYFGSEEKYEKKKEKSRYELKTVKNLIKEKVYYDLLKEIEPYIPEDKKELYEERKRKMRVFNF